VSAYVFTIPSQRLGVGPGYNSAGHLQQECAIGERGVLYSPPHQCAAGQGVERRNEFSYDVPLTDAAVNQGLDQFIAPGLVNGADGLEESSAIPERHGSETEFRNRKTVLPGVAYSMMSSNWQRSGFRAKPIATPSLRPMGGSARIDHPKWIH
jgi:hypothetical protein